MATSQLQEAVCSLRALLEPPPCSGEACAKLRAENARLLQLLKAHPAGPPPKPAMLPHRRLRIAARGGWKCAACGELLTETFHIDHIRPWVESLDNSDDNLQALCCADNASKTSAENSCRNKKTFT